MGFEHADKIVSPFVQYYIFMPRGSALLLGRVLLMYWHKMTRLVRDLLYIAESDIEEEVVIVTTVLSRDQLASRKYYYYLTRPFILLIMVILFLFLDLESLRLNFRDHFTFNLCSCSETCPWNTRVVQVLLHLWEVLQCTMYNQAFDPERPILAMVDCRVPGKL